MLKKFKLFGLIAAVLLVLYSWLGFLLVPAIALNLINQKLAEFSSEPARLQRLEFNPFNLKLDAWRLQIGDNNDTIAFEKLHLQLAWDSLWQLKLHLKSFHLEEPKIRIDINQLGELNLLKLFVLPTDDNQTEPEPDSSEDTAAPIIQVDLLRMSNGQVWFSDQRPAEQVNIDFNQLNFTVENLNTAPDEQGRLQFGLRIPDGTELHWSGELLLNPLTSYGQLRLSNLPLATWWPYAQAFTNLELVEGRLHLNSFYQLNLEDDLQLRLEDFSTRLEQLSLNLAQQPLLQLQQLAISQTNLDLQAQTISIGNISSSGLNTSLHIDRQGKLNWLDAIKPAPQPQAEEAASPEIEANSAFAGSGLAQLDWHLLLNQLQLENYRLAVSDLSRDVPIELEINQLNFSLRDLDSRSEQQVQIELDSQIGAQGQLKLAAKVNPQSLASHASINSSNLDLRPAQAFITPFARARLLSAMLNSELELQLPRIEPLALELSGKLGISQLHMQDNDQRRDLLKWHNLQLDQIRIKQDDDTALSIGQITLSKPYVRLIIDEQLHTNLSKVLVEQPETSEPEPAADNSSEPRLQLGGILIEDGAAHFADFSLTPHFVTALHDLNGKIGKLDNHSQQATPVKITGAVDRQAPVNISGELTPFDPMQQLDINTSFKQMELTTLTPYSGKFVGYRIHKGKLNLDLHYQIKQGQLNASNSVLLEQLQLGQKVDSQDAVQLPVKLALALLKDTKGNIDIHLPVQGDLNNPEFSVMPIVWQTLRNLITRAVSAPFKMLGSLVSSNQDLDKISFAAGSSELDTANQQSLLNLAKALQQRPLLKLNIEATSSASFDGAAVAENFLQLRIKQLWYADLQQRGKVVPADVAMLEVPERQHDKLLQQLYQQLPPEQQTEQPGGNKEQRLASMHTQLVQAYAQNQIRLRLLAQERAKSIRDFLVEQGGLEAERLFLLDVNEQAADDVDSIASMLHLDA